MIYAEEIKIDCSGVIALPSSFINKAFIKILEKHKEIFNKLKFINAVKEFILLMKQMVEPIYESWMKGIESESSLLFNVY